MNEEASSVGQRPDWPTWRQAVKPHERPDLRRSLWQLANSLIPYAAMWALMVWSLGASYWLTLALAIPAAGFLIRIFIIVHDCGHGSFFESRRANQLVGFWLGSLVFTSFDKWRHEHAVHHATSGDLGRRGVGDVWTLTVREYLDSPWQRRLAYRLVRNPFILFVLGPIYKFLIEDRFPWVVKGKARERLGVHKANLAIFLVATALILTIGWKAYVLVQLPVMVFAGMAGIWLFYVQHQFEAGYWQRNPEWDYLSACLEGSSYYALPRLLQWFSGNIGFHHVHHLSPAIPNYRLEEVHRENPMFQIEPITLRRGMRSFWLRLWDEDQQTMVGFRRLRELRAHEASEAHRPLGP